jgi:spermidine synthase
MTANTPKTFNRTVIFFIVFITGASVMVIELLGTRMIAPFYGASLYVWSALISVTMIALAMGYYIGGYWADRAERFGLSLIIALAALLTLLIPWLTRPVLLATDSLGLRLGAFVSALVLFWPSLTFLGMVSPFAIKLSTARLDGVGSSSGSIYAVSTVGSVVGTLMLSFFLFPMVGSRLILISVGITLLILAVLIALYEKKYLTSSVSILPSISLLVIGLCLLPKVVGAGHAYNGDNFQIQSEQESMYGWVRVIDQPAKNFRLLTSDASTIGAASLRTGQTLLTYQDIVGLIPAIKPNMKRALIVGLGAGHMAKVLHDQYGIETDTLEIDPAVSQAAVDYFDFKPTGKAIIGDARYEIRRLQGKYDLIIHDCFTGGTEPAHLLTVEVLEQLHSLLTEQGILAVNFVAFSSQDKNMALASVSKTIAQVFPQQTVFVSEPGKDFNDFIFLASQDTVNLTPKTLDAEQIAWLDHRVFKLDNSKGIVLTDDFNPIESLQTKKSEYYRRFVVDWLGADLLVR